MLSFQLAANLIAALKFDIVNGFHDAPNVTAAPVATKTLNRRQAIAWNTFWTFTPLFFANSAVAKMVGSGLLDTSTLTPPVITVGLVAAVTWGLITWRKGIPSSSTYALLGGLMGAAGFDGVQHNGWSLASFFAPAITGGWISVTGAMVAAPIAGFIVAWMIVRLATSQKSGVFCATEIMPKKSHAFLSGINGMIVGLFAAVDRILAWVENYGPSLDFFRPSNAPKKVTIAKGSPFIGTPQQYAQLFSSGYLSWAHARNDAMKTAGIMTVALHAAGLASLDVPAWVLAASFSTMAFGTMLGGTRIEKTLAEKLGYTSPNRGILAQVIAGGIVEIASIEGIPLSTTLAITGSTAGSNTAHNDSWSTAKKIIIRWGLTMPVTAAIAAGFMAMWNMLAN